jgi:hypothetical protein
VLRDKRPHPGEREAHLEGSVRLAVLPAMPSIPDGGTRLLTMEM